MLWLVALWLLIAAPWTAAAAPPDRLEDGGTAVVSAIIDADTAVLDDGRQVRFVGIQAPKLPLGRLDFPAWPLAEDAAQVVETMILGRAVQLRHGGARADRHGRILAHLVRSDGLWVQGEILRLGLARVYTFADNRALAAEMYALEREARADRRGIWNDPFYAVRAPTELDRLMDSFQIIEGKVVDAVKIKGIIYLNFDYDWRTDFTITIDGEAGKLFRQAKLDPLTLKNRTLRARGWIKRKNGPWIELSHPEPLEILDAR